MNRITLTGLSLVLASASVAARGSGDLVNLETATDVLRLSGDYLLFTAFEEQQSADLNGDGDQKDSVLHFVEVATQQVVNTGLAVWAQTGTDSLFSIEKGWVAFTVTESAQGGVDLNGDGDALDKVAHLYNPKTRGLINVGLDATSVTFDGTTLLLSVGESNQGNTILNGDGDTTDSVLHAFDFESGQVTNLGVAAYFADSTFQAKGRHIAVRVAEAQQGEDLTGDGDMNDAAMLIFERPGLTSTNLGVSVGADYYLEEDYLLFSVAEGQGVDLNGNGQLGDLVAHVVDFASGAVINLQETISGVQRFEGGLAYAASELDSGRDLNGDGDAFDHVVHYWSARSGLQNSGLAGYVAALTENLLVVGVSEEQQGVDLDGDGYTYTLVAHGIDLRTNAIVNTGSMSTPARADGDWMVYSVSESIHGDLNGDGDAFDYVARLMHVPTGTVQELGIAILAVASDSFTFQDGVAGISVWEKDQGALDLDGDGASQGHVLFLVEPGSAPVNVGVQSSPAGELEISADQIFLGVLESQSDLNGDGDQDDLVLHVYER